MKKSKLATTIAEAMIVVLVIVLWLTWVYKIYSESIKLNNSVETKIQAIQIAREWIEAITNIRDTNWLLFSSDTKNCWRTVNYDPTCIGDNWFSNNIFWDYKVYKDPNDNRWKLYSGIWITDNFSNNWYRDFYKIYLDNNWLFTHKFPLDTRTLKDTNWIFTRQIKVNLVDPWDWNTSNWLKINSIVKWVDSGWTNVNEVKLETILTNHKK